MVAFVVPHDPSWKRTFVEEASAIKAAFENSFVAVHHIGSTAIPGILAKPIIDLLGEVRSLEVADANTSALRNLGYEAMGAYGIEGRLYFRKINGAGMRTHHLHLFEQGSQHNLFPGTFHQKSTTFSLQGIYQTSPQQNASVFRGQSKCQCHKKVAHPSRGFAVY